MENEREQTVSDETRSGLSPEVQAYIDKGLSLAQTALEKRIADFQKSANAAIDNFLAEAREELPRFAQYIHAEIEKLGPNVETRISYIESALSEFFAKHFGGNHGFNPPKAAASQEDPQPEKGA